MRTGSNINYRACCLRLMALVVIACFVLKGTFLYAQPNALSFHKIDISHGLNDGIVRCMAQDKYGYIWIGTVGAVNRYDSRHIEKFTYQPEDSLSPLGTQIRSMHSDATGRFWIGAENGMMEFDFARHRFRRIDAVKGKFTVDIKSISDSTLLVGCRQGLLKFNMLSNRVFDYATSKLPKHKDLVNKQISSLVVAGPYCYIGTNRGLIVLNAVTDVAGRYPNDSVATQNILAMCSNKRGALWLVSEDGQRLQLLEGGRVSRHDADICMRLGLRQLEARSVQADATDNLWIATAGQGLIRYSPSTGEVVQYLHNAFFNTSPSSNSYRCIFSDRAGLIWLGCDVEGVNYFNPNQQLFSSILPFPGKLSEQFSKVGRGVTADKKGNIWMGNKDGLSRYNPASGEYIIWRNEENKPPILYDNMVRSLYTDEEDNIWIGTAGGVNKYVAATGKIEFIDKRYLPNSYFNSITGSKRGNIWFCTNDSATVYWYHKASNSFHNITEVPALKSYAGISPASYVYEDDDANKIYFSFSRKGLLMYDKGKDHTRFFSAEAGKSGQKIVGDLIMDIKKDKNGVVWLATFNGISAIDEQANRILSYNNQNGLPGNSVGSIIVDSLNRIWAGVNGGLTLMSPDRKTFTVFTQESGLPSTGFPEHAAVQLSNGMVIFPTYQGYFYFNPNTYQKPASNFPVYVSGYSIFDKGIISINPADSMPTISMKSHENSFRFYLSALNYATPSPIWFAYQLVGFDKEWRYTQDASAVYTNVPGGSYRFLVKASIENGNWEQIHTSVVKLELATVYYKTWWFRGAMAMLLLLALWAVYRYRIRQQQQLFELHDRAKDLEKEKAQVQYRNLKQQLNPHFLFNSLSSLNSLITTDQKEASKFLDALSKTYRYLLKSSDNETVSLSEELKFAANYVQLQRTRFEKGFEVSFDIPESLLHRKIVAVSLQNLIENAIKHNIIDEESPLHVSIYVEDDLLLVSNNLQRKNFVETSNRQGLASMMSLYSYLTHRPIQVVETSDTFTVKIPLL